MQIRVNGQDSFRALKSTFTVSKTSSGYTLQWCTFNSNSDSDWQSFSTPVPANDSLIVNGVTPFVFFRLSGNTDQDVLIIV